MKLTGYGKREWLGGGIIAFPLIITGVFISIYAHAVIGGILAVLFLSLWLCVAFFFRDPDRIIPSDPYALVSPADGAVRDIELISGKEENAYFDNKDALRIGIFLSVFNVHLNRAPFDLKVKQKVCRRGKYHDARSLHASEENEAVTLSCVAIINDTRFPLLIRQISGAIAKKIVCLAEKDMCLKKGERFGMIKFGSRTELFLPAQPDIQTLVKVGDRLFAGASVIAKVKKETADENETKFPSKDRK